MQPHRGHKLMFIFLNRRRRYVIVRMHSVLTILVTVLICLLFWFFRKKFKNFQKKIFPHFYENFKFLKIFGKSEKSFLVIWE